MRKRKYITLLLLLIALIVSSDAKAQDIPVRRTPSGIIIMGNGGTVRAFEPYSGKIENVMAYSAMVNHYADTFSPDVKVFCMVIPTAVGLYCPDKAKAWTKDENTNGNAMIKALSDKVTAIDLFPVMRKHLYEPIYSRTDHHWAPLGAYYAAQAFAQAAGVPFMELSQYDKNVIHNYVGTMYRFSKDAFVKRAPEEFVYYTPKGVEYKTTYIKYHLDKGRKKVVGEDAPTVESFFRSYPDGDSHAYLTFFGGDDRTIKVETSTKNNRRLVILKDSYGNAIPGYLFGSFEEIHVIDCRYFTKNITRYVRDNKITDILFANNIIHASQEKTVNSYAQYLRLEN